jgi:hypothetical protein
MVVVTTPPVIRDFGKQSRNRPGIDPDVVETLVEFKDSYFADPDPAHWTVSMVEELMLAVLPRQVAAPDEWFAAVTPTTRAYLEFLADRGRLATGSDSPRELLAAVDRIGDRALAASRDPRNFGMTKAIFAAVGYDPSLPDPARSTLEAFNALPDDERAAIVDPTLHGVGSGGAWSLPAFGDPLADSTDRPHLPMIWLPPAVELAAAVRAAPLVRDLLRLTAWNGARHKVTRSKVLPLADARRACADLGLPIPTGPVRTAERIPALQRLWSLALDSGLLDLTGGAAVRGDTADLLTDLASDPDDVVSWWLSLLDTCLVEGLDLVDDPDEDEDPDEDVLAAVDDALPPLLVELYSAGRVPLDVPERAIGEVVASPWTAEDLFEDEVHEQALRRWRAHVAQLVDVGAATVEDAGLDLTPLGRTGVRAIALDDGGEAPLIDDPATLDAATLLRTLPPLGRSVGQPLLAEWSGARRPAQAVDQILDAARSGTAGTRLTASTVLKEVFGDHLRGAGRPQLEALRDDPVLAAYAQVLLTEPGQPVQLPPHLQQWTALEAVAVFLESEALEEDDPTHDADSLAALWQIVEENADLGSAWASSHPQLSDILDAIATRHPKGRIRKAARKALFKTRNRQP